MVRTAEIAITAELPGPALGNLAADYPIRVRKDRGLLSEAELSAFIGQATAAITLLADPVTEAVFAACPELRIVANYAVGYNNIDLEAARARGIWITNTPDVLTEATADLTWALILAVTRRLVEADAFLRAGSFIGWHPQLLLGAGLRGKNLGLIGYGRIGRAVARRGRVFGLNVRYTDPIGEVEDRLQTARHIPLDELLASSHILSLHCPLAPDTHHLLDRQRLSQLRPGAFLINTARGPLVDEQALAELLIAGHLAGAGLDVYENEPKPEPALLELPNVVLLPHVGSATSEARIAMADLAVANVRAVLAGNEPGTVVRPA